MGFLDSVKYTQHTRRKKYKSSIVYKEVKINIKFEQESGFVHMGIMYSLNELIRNLNWFLWKYWKIWSWFL